MKIRHRNRVVIILKIRMKKIFGDEVRIRVNVK